MESFEPSADFTLIRKTQENAKPEKRTSGLLIPTTEGPMNLSRCEVIASEKYKNGDVIVLSSDILNASLSLNGETFFVVQNSAILGKIVNK